MLRYVDHLVFDATRLGNPQWRALKGRTTDLNTPATTVTLANDKAGVMVLDGSLQSLVTATLNKNSLTILRIKGLPVLATLKISDGSPMVLDIERLPALRTVQAYGMNAVPAWVDGVLGKVRSNADLFGIDNGTLDLSDSLPPTGGQNNPDYLGLVVRGWTVSIGWA